MPAGRCLSQNEKNRILARSLGALYEGFSKADFFDFMCFHTVLTNVLNTILRPYELIDCHFPILRKQIGARKKQLIANLTRIGRESS
jgi:hypothetical protein